MATSEVNGIGYILTQNQNPLINCQKKFAQVDCISKMTPPHQFWWKSIYRGHAVAVAFFENTV